jgi:accessory colonization factor AcfC
MKKVSLIIILTFLLIKGGFAQTDTLHVYGPGGPFSAVHECATAFTKQTGIPVKVIAGPEPKWIAQAQQNADVIFEGAEYMLTQFDQAHLGMLDLQSKTELYKRAATILVRPGNPRHIKGLPDLARPGIKLLDVNGAGQLGLWEDLAGRANLISGIQRNIGASFANTALGIEAWKHDSTYDAWITYASWHENLKNETALVRLPKSQVLYRGTPLAVTKGSRYRSQAQQFITFMQSSKGHRIFQKWGWN